MNFKKGDIVEVIKRDNWDGLTYYEGTKWEVIGCGDDTHYYVRVKDPRQLHGYAPLFYDYVKKVEEGKLMNKQEIKEKLKENGAWCTECHTGEHGRYVEMGKAMELIEQLYEPQKPEEVVEVVEEVEEYESEVELLIPVSLVYQVLASEPTNREIKAFLKGYTEGLNKLLTT